MNELLLRRVCGRKESQPSTALLYSFLRNTLVPGAGYTADSVYIGIFSSPTVGNRVIVSRGLSPSHKVARGFAGKVRAEFGSAPSNLRGGRFVR